MMACRLIIEFDAVDNRTAFLVIGTKKQVIDAGK